MAKDLYLGSWDFFTLAYLKSAGKSTGIIIIDSGILYYGRKRVELLLPNF